MRGPYPNPESLAFALAEHAEEAAGKDAAQDYLVQVVVQLFAVAPAVLERVIDKWFIDLTEDLSRRSKEDAMKAVLEVRDHWNQEV